MHFRLFENVLQNVKSSYILKEIKPIVCVLRKSNQNSNDLLLVNKIIPNAAVGLASLINSGSKGLQSSIVGLDSLKPNEDELLPKSKSIHWRFNEHVLYKSFILKNIIWIHNHQNQHDEIERRNKSTDTNQKNEGKERKEPSNGHNNKKFNRKIIYISGSLFIGALSFFNFFGPSNDPENDDPNEKLIATIKRSVICIQREQYDKAEQMLHLALRMAQDLQNRDGITYIYDVMANLAMERRQYKKAEKLFADVLKRLFNDGKNEENPKVLHISSKLAHMAQLQGELEKAYQGFTWTLEKLAKAVKSQPDDKEMQELFGLTKNWFGELLMQKGRYMKAKENFEEAYKCLVEVYGDVNDAAITILNNLSVACCNLDDFAGAKEHINHAMALVKKLKDTSQEGILYANLGLIYLREGLLKEAKESCSLAWRIGKKQQNPDAIEQAEYCLNELKSSF